MENKIQSLFWGILAAGAALFIELILASLFKIDILESIASSFVIIIILSVFVEEIIKYIIIIKKIDDFSFGRSAIINSWIAGAGFASVEMFLIYQKILSDNIILNESDFIKITLLHMLTFGIFGYRITIRKDNILDYRTFIFLFSLHLLYNLSAQFAGEFGYFMGISVLTILFLYNIFGFFVVNKRLAHE